MIVILLGVVFLFAFVFSCIKIFEVYHNYKCKKLSRLSDVYSLMGLWETFKLKSPRLNEDTYK